MAQRRYSKALQRTALSAALGLCFATAAYAQSNTGGAVFGQAQVGDTVLIENAATGFTRTIAVGNDGSFRQSALAPGSYRVTVRRTDGSTSVRDDVRVSVGTGTPVTFAAAAAPGAATTLGTIQVTGSFINPIDVSSVESSTIMTAERIAKIPVPRNVTTVALLAPGTVRGDAAFGNLASFGGSSVAENQYFVNGFNITNAFKNLNFAQIPFEGIAEQQIKTGGYGAEFGRSTGGVINIITRRGTNEFKAGASVYYTPDSLRGTMSNSYQNDGELRSDNSRDTLGDETVAAVWAGGALVQDTLFGYGLIQYRDSTDKETFGDFTSATNASEQSNAPNYLVKLDWNINDNNLLEFTSFSDKQEVETDRFRTTPVGSSTRGDYVGTIFEDQGGLGNSLRYTGYLTDTFTLSALYGHGEFERNMYGITAAGIRQSYDGNINGVSTGCPIIVDSRPAARAGTVPRITGCNFIGMLGRNDAIDERDQFRIDADWQLGDHLVRFGYDADDFTSVAGESYEGGHTYTYQTSGGVDRVRDRIVKQGATVEVNQEAFYVEDTWNITSNFIGYLGLRLDSFKNKNGDGDVYVEQKDQFAPRLGFSWDVGGDSTLKVFGNAGRYALPLTPTVAIRGASASIFSEDFYSFTGTDPVTGAPLGAVKIVNPATGSTDTRFLNNEFGVAQDHRTMASKNLDPMYQDEFILGFQKQLGDNFSVGLKATRRDLKASTDDTCDYRPFVEWAADHGKEFNPQNPAFPYCRIYNPGSDLVVDADVDGDGVLEEITIPASVIGPASIRRYNALEASFEGNWDRFFLQGSYTWSKSYGNTEGGVKSDIGQDDTGVTQDFDYPELAIGSYGDLPNDRRHTVKLFGNYEFNDQWSVGMNALVQSGRPVNCIGFLGDAELSRYGNSYFSCDPGPANEDSDNGMTIVPRGTAGRTPWSYTFDVNVQYRPVFADGKLALKFDVFNVFDSSRATAVDEDGEDGAGNPLLSTTYKNPITFEAPRAVRFSAQYDF